MNVAIFHHHLNRGGVTQVIANQLRSLNEVIGPDTLDVFLFYGGRKAAWPKSLTDEIPNIRLHEVVVEGLDYAEECEATVDGRVLAESIENRFRDFGLETDNCILHVHNLSLGRNWAFIEAIHRLQNAGYRMLLQIHDFAEDFRPDNYQRLKESADSTKVNLAQFLYPAAEHVVYGVINRRDASYLQTQGIPLSRINYLPNPVSAVKGLTPIREAKAKLELELGIDAGAPFLIYPVRGIRRKNIGEALLLTLLANSPVQIGLTLPPLNPVESTAYESWKELSHQLRLPVWFEAGNSSQLEFPDVLSAADQILTTSVAEGFGMVFLEAFAIGKPLIGRDIPQITADFVEAGISFDNLYESIRVPLESLFLSDYQSILSEILSRFFQSYGLPFDQHAASAMVDRIREQGWIDFAKLPLEMQKDFIRAAYRDPSIRAHLKQLNQPVGQRLVESSVDQKTVEINRLLVEQSFSFGTIGRQVLDVYRGLSKTEPRLLRSQEDGNQMVQCFLNPDEFYPIRFEKSEPPRRQTPDWTSIVLANSKPLQPIPTQLEPRLQHLPDVRVVMFDIYGTLLVSSSGDVGTDEKFERTSDEIGAGRLSQMLSEVGLDMKAAQTQLKRAVLEKHQVARQHSVPHPEIDIIQIWKQLIESGVGSSSNLSHRRSKRWIQELAIRFELAANPVFPMPGMRETIDLIRTNGMKIGIVSNAQFYTRPILEAFCQMDIEELGFERDLTFFSYSFGRGKPDVFLYEWAAYAIANMGFQPGQVLYVGNDMTKDMVPAKTVGFKVGLFAGDQRSLRWGQHRPPLTASSVDLILTELTQIDECISNPT